MLRTPPQTKYTLSGSIGPIRRGVYTEMRFVKKLFLIFILLISTAFANPSLREQLLKGKPGDFIVISQGNSYSLFLLRDLNDKFLTIEEISVDQSAIDLKKIGWKQWVENKAPGVTTWTSFVINLEKNTLTQCYSYTEKQWLFLEKSDYFFNQLLTLPLRVTKDNERKRVGPPPMPGEIDRRKLWGPKRVLEGKCTKTAQYSVLRAKWPDDKTRLAGCVIELYLDTSQPQFPFPYWLEIQSPHYTFKLNTIDSGSGICSPVPPLMNKLSTAPSE